MRKKKPTILWLSDIHFKCLSDQKLPFVGQVRNYLAALVEYIIKRNYTHILISGDLVFSGKEKEYNELYLNFIEKIRKQREDVRLITMCGNHDIEQSVIKANPTPYAELLDLRHGDKKKVIQNQALLKEGRELNKKHPLLELSRNYRGFFKKNGIKDQLKSLVENGCIEDIGYSASDGLFGVVYDKEYDLVFNILHSSWYAFGFNKVIDLSLEDCKLKEQLAGNNAQKARAIKEIAKKNERENLVYGTLQFQNDILESLEKRMVLEECFVISAAHHPFDWMHYDIINGDLKSGKNLFADTIGYTDIFLAGHTHVPHFYPSIFRNQCHLLAAPQVLDYKMYQTDRNSFYPKNSYGFSLISLDHAKSSYSLEQVRPIEDFYIAKAKFIGADDNGTNPLIKREIVGGKKIVPRDSFLENFEGSTSLYLSKNLGIKNLNSIEAFDEAALKSFLESCLASNETTSYAENEDFLWIYDSKKCLLLPKNLGIHRNDLAKLLPANLVDLIKKPNQFGFLDNMGEDKEMELIFFDFFIYNVFRDTPNLKTRTDFWHELSYIFESALNEFYEDNFIRTKHQLIRNLGLAFEIIGLKSYRNYLQAS